ncbi:hypothetical protein WSM22_17960 [Cytophagales bacterium WSM2-2]|nr:hypothetical protein WSM22_17960 [Cytophagales bacterium WSM2-2]
MNPDIETRDHVIILVNSFYEKVKSDLLLAPVFRDVDWPNHLPVMYDFWSSMLLGDRSYFGNPLKKHLPLKINSEHFERWLLLFKATINEHFTGDKAEETKMRAESIAAVFQFKMGISQEG